MKNALALLIVSCASLTISSAQAQELQSVCLQQVEDLCGQGSVSQCFADESLWDFTNEECHGDIQTLIEMDREANAESGFDSSGSGAEIVGSGLSYGGVLRDGPGSDYNKLGSLRDGDDIEIVEPTGEWSGGYQWYVVNSRVGEGFHWGGIFCSQEPLEGVLTTCSEGI
jgi:hypothetical protein